MSKVSAIVSAYYCDEFLEEFCLWRRRSLLPPLCNSMRSKKSGLLIFGHGGNAYRMQDSGGKDC